MLHTENPLENPIPDDMIELIHTYARDLALGVVRGWWGAEMEENDTNNIGRNNVTPLVTYQSMPPLFAKKWTPEKRPRIALMHTFGYISRVDNKHYYTLTRTAFDLLKRPPTAPAVFVSYSRSHSTTFALYIEARLRNAGNHDVFVDKALEPGSQWRDVLEEKIRASRYFVVICAPGTLESEWVRKEIELAKQAGCTLIPILHHDMQNRDLPDTLGDYQTIKVQDRTAAEYETSVNKLLSFMGYATY